MFTVKVKILYSACKVHDVSAFDVSLLHSKIMLLRQFSRAQDKERKRSPKSRNQLKFVQSMPIINKASIMHGWHEFGIKMSVGKRAISLLLKIVL